MSHLAILKIDKSGKPLRWISKEHATSLVCSGKVLWAFGDQTFAMRGGINKSGKRSIIHLSPIIAVDGAVVRHAVNIPLMNKYLFRRDQHLCMYCGQTFSRMSLTRDHILPRSRGGKDLWTNVVSACKPCNQRKGARLPEEAKMPLLAVPFKPTFSELLYLQNHDILDDQMHYLRKGFRHLPEPRVG
jgi:HNH endonuclease